MQQNLMHWNQQDAINYKLSTHRQVKNSKIDRKIISENKSKINSKNNSKCNSNEIGTNL